ncbi:MAG: hypothetical protein JJE18_10855 [Eubacteriaceae bacterium]|nr:hypothetical protein [Eubacteriaceae bacterium]
MKKFISIMILMIGLLVTLSPGNQVKASTLPDQTSFAVDNPNIAPAVLAQEEGGVQAAPEQTSAGPEATGNFFSDNWGALLLGLLGFFDLVARLTPTEKDNSVVNFLMTLFNAIIPNLKKGGGSFRLLSK